jgi:ribosomal protein S14
MSMVQKQAFCRQCNRPTLHVKAVPGSQFGKHLAMVIVDVATCGQFLPFHLCWAIYSGWEAGRQRYRCQFCGQG